MVRDASLREAPHHEGPHPEEHRVAMRLEGWSLGAGRAVGDCSPRVRARRGPDRRNPPRRVLERRAQPPADDQEMRVTQRWKAAASIVPGLVAVAIAFVVVSLLLSNFGEAVQLPGVAIVCLAGYLAAVKWIERREPTELSLHHALPVLAAGLLGGIALFSLVMAIEW